MDPILLIVLSIAIGLAIGVLSGLIGVGGGTVLVPVFKLAYGMSAIASTATSLFTIIPTSLTGAITHIRNKTCIIALGVAAGIGGACTSPVGVWLASISPEWAIMITAALVIGYSAITMFRKAFKLRRKQHAPSSAFEEEGLPVGSGDMVTRGHVVIASQGFAPSLVAPPFHHVPAPDEQVESPAEMLVNFQSGTSKVRQIVTGAIVGLFAGVVSGYVGVGGGFIMVPMFMQLLHTPMKLTSGTSLIAVMILAIPGAITQVILGNVDWLAGLFVAIGTIPGAVIGAKLMTRVSEFVLRLGFAAFLLIAATLLVINQLGVI